MKGLLNPEKMGLGLDPCLEFIAFCGDSTDLVLFTGLFQRFILVWTRGGSYLRSYNLKSLKSRGEQSF